MNVIGMSGLHQSLPFKKREFPHLSSREYHIAQGFDSAAALVTPAGVQAAAAEERFTGQKKTGAFPVNAIQYCLQAADLAPDEIDYIAHGFSYEPYRSFFKEDTFTQKQFAEVYAPEVQVRTLQEHLPKFGWADKFVPVPHHLSHAASAFYLSGFQQALILIVDGMGEAHSTTVAIGHEQDGFEIIRQVTAPHSLGILYGIFTHYLGFSMNVDEYKVMGLAPYGNPRRYFNKVMDFINLKSDGTYTIPLLFENKSLEEKETYRGTLQVLADTFGPPREPKADITQTHKDIAAALQAVLQASLMQILRHFKQETGQNQLCMAGGVALNCTANGVIHRSRLFRDIFIQPAAADDGTALGAALYVQRFHRPDLVTERMPLPLWGPSFEPETIDPLLKNRPECESESYDDFDTLAKTVVQRLAAGQVIAWFQGRMEFGPRALGNRSILADPRNPTMRDRVNRLVKKREGFRPFAPAVTAEAAPRFFEIKSEETHLFQHMLFVAQVKPAYQQQLPAVTHIDGSARVQVVSQADNQKFWNLLKEFEAVSNIPVLLNTSFNLRGQPIVCTPHEAIETFLASEIDTLVIENHLITHENSA